ncbi:MAG: pirin family protein [Gammaproteobacteria bacterium]|nr:MAG: pirin family protein [Gammaproteobacteria bacterium]
MAREIHRSDSRGTADHGWLKSRHSFSFADYHNPQRMGFGMLRVINDDVVAPSRGFATHSHSDMEIISIPLAGALRHKDSMGNQHIISAGEVQIMSAGTGISHSEYNHSTTDDVNFLQIWILPDVIGIEPRYEQKRFAEKERKNRFQLLVSPAGDHGSIRINQKAWFSMVDLDRDQAVTYQARGIETGFYVFVIEGDINIDNDRLAKRDALAISDDAPFTLKANADSQVLCIEVPLRKSS